MSETNPDTTCSASTASGKSCQSAAALTLHGLPYCHRKSHQKQAKAATKIKLVVVPSPVEAVEAVAVVAAPVAAPVQTSQCPMCGRPGIHLSTRQCIHAGRVNQYACSGPCADYTEQA
jgi:hypothetical protein